MLRVLMRRARSSPFVRMSTHIGAHECLAACMSERVPSRARARVGMCACACRCSHGPRMPVPVGGVSSGQVNKVLRGAGTACRRVGRRGHLTACLLALPARACRCLIAASVRRASRRIICLHNRCFGVGNLSPSIATHPGGRQNVQKSRLHRGFARARLCDPFHNPRSLARPWSSKFRLRALRYPSRSSERRPSHVHDRHR